MWWLLQSALVCAQVALVSKYTPPQVLIGLAQAQDVVQLRHWPSPLNHTMVFDFLSNLGLSLVLLEELGSVVINGNRYSLPEQELFPNVQQQSQAIAKLLERLPASKILLICSPDWPLPDITLRVSTLCVSQQLSSGSLELLMLRAVKTQAIATIVLWTAGELALEVLRALEKSGLDYEVTVLLVEEAAWLNRTEVPDLPGNILCLVKKGCENCASQAAVLNCRLRQRVSGALDQDFTVLQLHQGSAHAVGSVIQGQASLCLDCLQWKAVSAFDTRSVTLQFSFNSGTDNPSGPANTGEEQFYWGALMAVEDINQRTDVLPYGVLRVFNVSLGLSEFDPVWVRKQLAGVTVEDLGLTFLHGHYSNVAIPLYSFLTNFNYTRPQISGDNTSGALSSHSAFPLYARVAISSAYNGVMFARFIRRYRWTRFALLSCDDLYCTSLAQILVQAAKDAKLDIVTNSSTWTVPADMTSYPDQLLPVFQAMIDSKARIVVLIMYGTTLNYCLDVLYDLGMRRGDMVFLSVMWLLPTLFVGTDESVQKRKELLNGAIQIYPAAFVGPLGKDIHTRFLQKYGVDPPHFACTNYDAVLLLAHTLDYLRTTGADYTQTAVLSRELRRARFTGCTGDVSLQEGDRLPSVFAIQNAVVQASGTVDIREVGTYSPLGTVLFTFSQDITWPNGTAVVPGDTRVNPLDCPFEEKDMQDFLPALVLEVGSCVLFGLLATLTTGLIWRKYWRQPVSSMQGQVEVSFEDYLLFVSIGVEAVQYCYLGAALPPWLYEADNYMVVVHWDFSKVLPKSRKVLLISVAISLGAVSLWVCLLLAAALRLKCGLIGMGYHLLPYLGSVCFIPILMSLLSLFQCGQAASASGPAGFEDTYLLDDCYMQCWTGMHLSLTVPTVLALGVYVPSAVYLRPKWQEVQQTLHIPISPPHLMVKSLYQLLAVIGNRALAQHGPLEYTVVFAVLTLAYLGASVCWRPYGYGRANLWHFVGMVGVLWYSAVVTVSRVVVRSGLVWLSVLSGGVGVLFAAAQLLQLFIPSRLYCKQGRSVVTLLRFQFSRHPDPLTRTFSVNHAYVIPGPGSYDDLTLRHRSITNNT